jgi:hypothetical protein
VSFDDGANWQPLQMNLPHAPVYWLVVQEHFNDLVIATYGRGFWILDDVTPLRALTPEVLNADAHLFMPRPAYRFRAITAPATTYDDPVVGQNPPYGADINYYLKSASPGNVTIAIQDTKGQVVRTMTGPQSAGLHRVYWDLRSAPSKGVELRTSPLYSPEIEVGPDGLRRSSGGFGAGGGRMVLLEPPGTYTVKLTVNGRDFTQPLTVIKDPHSAGTEADIAAQHKMMLELRQDLDAAVDLVNELELVRGQLAALNRVVNDPEVKKASDDLDKKYTELEQFLVELRATGRGQDGVRWGSKLVGKMGYLANGLASADFKPTNQEGEVEKLQQDRLKSYRTQLEVLRSRDLDAFNEMLKKKGYPTILPQPTRRPTS